jgi:hypothetical protein
VDSSKKTKDGQYVVELGGPIKFTMRPNQIYYASTPGFSAGGQLEEDKGRAVCALRRNVPQAVHLELHLRVGPNPPPISANIAGLKKKLRANKKLRENKRPLNPAREVFPSYRSYVFKLSLH